MLARVEGLVELGTDRRPLGSAEQPIDLPEARAREHDVRERESLDDGRAAQLLANALRDLLDHLGEGHFQPPLEPALEVLLD